MLYINLNRKKIIFFLYLILLFIALEVTLNILNIPAEYKIHTYPGQFKAMPDTDYIYVNLPNSDIAFTYNSNPRGYFNDDLTVKHQTNIHGFRGPDFSIHKASSTIRIIFLGDSFTFGEGVYFTDTFPEQFRQLAQKNNLFQNNNIEVISLAVGGYNTRQEVALLEDFALNLDPDYIVLSYTLNDAEPNLFFFSGNNLQRKNREQLVPENISQISTAPIIISWFNASRAIWTIFQQEKQNKKLIAYYQSLYQNHPKSWFDTKKAFKKLTRISKQHKIPAVIIIFPLLFQLNDNYPFFDANQLIKQNLADCQLPYIDLFPYLQNKQATDLWVHPADQHPNEIVHAVVGQIIFDYFQNLLIDLSRN